MTDCDRIHPHTFTDSHRSSLDCQCLFPGLSPMLTHQSQVFKNVFRFPSIESSCAISYVIWSCKVLDSSSAVGYREAVEK
jgi:hypothetical protein